MREEVTIFKRTCDLCGCKMHNEDDDRDLDFEEGKELFSVRSKVEDVRIVNLSIQAVGMERMDGSWKQIQQCCTSCLHELLGTDDGK